MRNDHRLSSVSPARLRPRRRGFTLIELLVAISILAIVAVLGWRGLDGIVRARVALTDNLEQTRGMQLTFAQMQRDCAHLASASLLPNRAPLVVEPTRIVLVRAVNTEDQATRLQIVAYHLRDGVLTRRESAATRDLDTLDMYWVAATSDADNAQIVNLQKGVASMTSRLWVKDGTAWEVPEDLLRKTSAADSGATSPFGNPIGLEVALQLNGREHSMTKIFLLGSI